MASLSGDTASFSDLSVLLECSPLGDDQIQELVDMLLTRKDDGWQSANKTDDSVTNWKKKFNEVKEQYEDSMLMCAHILDYIKDTIIRTPIMRVIVTIIRP